ncbi:MAG: DUF4190 domain-containing protein [Eubacterium sp.]|nr:DUF4190 domain-containing protein [Eubacterium sp.]
MKQCTFCGAELKDDARACNNCGRPVPDMPEPEEASVPEKKGEAKDTDPQPADQMTAQQDQQTQQTPENAQSPWNPQNQQTQSPWDPQGRQMQNPWSPQGRQVQAPWEQQTQEQQTPWTPWGQQNPQEQQENRQGQQLFPWGWQQNDPGRPLSGGQYPGSNLPRNAQMQRYNPFALWSLVFGFLASFLNGLILIPSIIAIVCGINGLIQIGKEPQTYKGTWMAVLGLVCGIFFLTMFACGYMLRMVLQNPELYEQLQQILKGFGAGV